MTLSPKAKKAALSVLETNPIDLLDRMGPGVSLLELLTVTFDDEPEGEARVCVFICRGEHAPAMHASIRQILNSHKRAGCMKRFSGRDLENKIQAIKAVQG